MIDKLPPVVNIEHAAKVAGVGRETIRRWIRKGRLTIYHRTDAAGSARTMVDSRSLLRYLGMVVPEDT